MFPQIFGKYVLEREIAAGGMARVYLATLRGAVGFEKRLVVKQIRAELATDSAFVTRFIEEAKTAVELSHPNIVPVYELGVEQGVYYIAMELCEGLTLCEVLAETGPLEPTEGAYLGAEICRALDYAHRRAHIVHRDVTPRNVLIDDEGAVRLIDFGISAPVTRADDTSRSEVFGSPGHMPPEQLHGAELSPATDVFAVGVLLIEAWTGFPPFRRATAQDSERALFSVPARIDQREPRLAPLSDLLARSVALDARERPSGAEQLARPLRAFIKTEDSGDLARSLGERVRRARCRARAEGRGSPAEERAHGVTHPWSSDGARDGAAVTRTFAARQDLEIWTRKLSSVPAPLLPTPAATPRSLKWAEIGLEAAAPAADDAAAESASPSASRAFAPSPVGIDWRVLVAVALAFVALAFSLKGRAPPPAVDGRAREPSVAASAALAATKGQAGTTALSARAVVALQAPPAAVAPEKLSGVARGVARETLAQAAARVDAEQVGQLRITADPRATVEITGAGVHELRRTPLLGLALPAGKYQLTFRNDTFGAAVGVTVMVLAGSTRSAHADFRLAEPAVTVR